MSQHGADIKSQLQFTDVDLESCLGQLFGLRRLEGKGNMSLNVEGNGDSVLAVTRTMNGNATLTGQNGALPGSMSSNCCAGWSGGRFRAAATSAPAARRTTRSRRR